MRAFVTGGTGFVGSHLVEELLRRGYEVRALARGDLKWLEGLPVEIVRGGLLDHNALREAMQGVDVLHHVAGLTRAPDAAALDRANVEGTIAVLDAAEAAGVPRALVTSSLAAVGPSGSEPLSEEAPLRPLSRYGESKAKMERAIAARQAKGRGPEVVVVRPPVVYGPREADIYTILRAAARQRLFPVVGPGRTPQLDLVHVRDLVRGMADAAESDRAMGETYFLGGPRPYAWNEIREAAIAALGRSVLRVNVPRPLVGPAGAAAEAFGRLIGQYPPLNREKAREAKASWVVSSEKARRHFGYQPEVDVEEGMRETVDWYRQHGWL
ncbi:MAG TPA: NAD-dependent epimerase/dehydratase family protein [Rubricoccaceae bacterium]|nr:NAD-dependent epimerase/dehydratase family protein [Rubricoccaceae bacterium]